MRRLKRIQAALWALLLLLNVLLPAASYAADGDASGIQLEMRSTETVVDSGKLFTFEIDYSVSSTTDEYTNAVITLQLPPVLKFDDAIDTGDTTHLYDPVTNTITFDFKTSLSAGTTGTLQVNAAFYNYTTPDGTTAIVHSVFQSDQGSVTSNDVTVTSRASAHWELTKVRSRPIDLVTPKPGSEVEYQITLRDEGAGPYGKLELQNVVVTDTLPEGAEFVSARPATANYDPVSRNVIWNVGLLGEGVASRSFYVKVKYPEDISGTVTNDAKAEFTALGGSLETLTAQVSHGFTPISEDKGTDFHKSVDSHQQEVSPGQEVNFYIGNLYSRSNVDLQNYEVTDMTPPGLQFVQVSTAKFSGIPSGSYKVQYTLSDTPGPADWIDWATVAADAPETLKASDAPVSGADVKGIKFVIGTVPIDFTQTSNFQIRYKVDDSYPAPVYPGAEVTNTATLRYDFEGAARTDSRSADVYIVQGRPLIEVTKTAANGSNFSPGDTVHYKIRVSNSEYSSSVFHNPIVTDLLPESLEYVDGSMKMTQDGGLGLADPKTEAVPDPDTGRTLLKWYWDDILPATVPVGKTVEFEFDAVIKAGTATGYIENEADVTSDQHAYLNNADFTQKRQIGGKWHLYNIGAVYVNSVAKLVSTKWVQGDLDGNVWTKYPSTGHTTPGGKVEYKLEIVNVGNVPVNSLLVVDALPRIGDKGVVAKAPRDSKWSPVLTEEVNLGPLAAVAKVFYTGDTDINMSGGHWSETPPADLTRVTGLKFEFSDGYVINPGQKLELGWIMRAPIGAPEGEAAWSSFGFTAKRSDNRNSLLTTEPLKVGVIVASNTEAEIGNYVWRDVNNNGIQDEGSEHGVNGIPVELYAASALPDDPPLQTTITGNDQSGHPGYYLFTNLPAGSYKVQFKLPPEYADTGWVAAQNAGGDGALDSDVNPGDGTTGIITVAEGEKNDTVDAGLVAPTGKIGDTVWIDVNGDGLQDPEDDGVEGVQINLYDGNGYLLETTVTDADGKYEFNYLTPGTYEVEFIRPAGKYRFTQANAGSDDEIDSDASFTDASQASAKSGPIVLASGENLSIDAGLIIPTASIGDFVWIDADEDGIQDAGETGIKDINVRLLDGRGNELATQKTAADGSYRFDELWAGTYKVRFELPNTLNYMFTSGNAGSDDELDSDIAPADISGTRGTTQPIILAHNEHNGSIDAGIVEGRSKIGDRLWIDDNDNGIQDADEPGLGGVTVHLLDANGSTVRATDVTDDDGYYLFDRLVPGEYYVRFQLPGGYKFTVKNNGPEADDSDADTEGSTTGRSDLVQLTVNGESNLDIDAGLIYAKSKLGNRVWIDDNRNGIQDPDEQGLNGVTVRLLGGSGGPVTTTTVTDAEYGPGFYVFDELWDATYTIEVELPDPLTYRLTPSHKGGDDELDSDAFPASLTLGRISGIVLPHAKTDYSFDIGLIKGNGKIGNKVWIDNNDDGIQDPGEPGLGGVRVQLLDDTGTTVLSEQTTEPDGSYLFADLLDDDYSIRFILPDELKDKYRFTIKGAGDADEDSDADASGRTGIISLGIDEQRLDIDAGLIEPKASVGDYVWIDHSGDGSQADDDVKDGLGNVKVTLYTEDGQFVTSTMTTVNDAVYGTGYYRFDKLWAGNYYVEFELPNTGTYKFTASGTAADNMDSDVADFSPDGRTGKTAPFPLAQAQFRDDIDAGVIAGRSALGDKVWIDRNDDGVQNDDEPGLGGVTVKLLDGGGTEVASTVTDSNGSYLFEHLYAGTYRVRFELALRISRSTGLRFRTPQGMTRQTRMPIRAALPIRSRSALKSRTCLSTPA
jgi:fimbrial isopeptide formation D2 family protein/uncharacterized repeat protein (TIGR01451 family)